MEILHSSLLSTFYLRVRLHKKGSHSEPIGWIRPNNNLTSSPSPMHKREVSFHQPALTSLSGDGLSKMQKGRGEKKKKRKKSCHYRHYIIRTSGCFSPAIFHRHIPPSHPPSKFCWRASERGSEVPSRRTRGHNQGWWFHWIFIIRQGWSPAGHYLIIALERTVKISLLQDFICLHGAIHVSADLLLETYNHVLVVYVTI